jgi:dihydroflavonol-4-reductase
VWTRLIHTASPFPIAQPKDPETLIRPAVEGTLRALSSARAKGVPRVVLTSSIAAIVHRGGRAIKDETDWVNPDDAGVTPYARSKVMAERAAWDYVRDEAKGMALTVINPGFVLGPPLDGRHGSSVGVIARILSGKDPMVPQIGFPIVDVRDVARMHLIAAQDLRTAGKRFIASAGSMSMPDMARLLALDHPERKIATRIAPRAVLRLLALFDPQIRAILPVIGQMDQVSAARAQTEMGMSFIPPADSLRATAEHLLAQG